MSSNDAQSFTPGLSLRQAAIVTGIAYFLMPVAVAEFYIKPKLIIADDIERTSQNIAPWKAFCYPILCYFVTLIMTFG